VGSVAVGAAPYGVAVNGSNGYAYVANSGASSVTILDGLSTVATISTPSSSHPTGVLYDPAGGYVYVTGGSPWVSVIQGTTVVNSTLLEGLTCGSAYDSLNGEVYILSCGVSPTTVVIFRGLDLVGSFQLPSGYSVGSIVFDPDNGYMYFSNSTGLVGSVLVVSGTQVIASILVGDTPGAMASDSANGDVYVVNVGSTNVSVIHGTSLVGTVSFGYVWSMRLSSIAFDSANGYVYVASSGTNNVSVINGTSAINSVPVGWTPTGCAFDPVNGYVYVSNSGTNNVTALEGSIYYPGISQISVLPPTVQVNSTTIATTTLDVNATNGEGVLSFAYSGLPPGCISSNLTRLSCTPTYPGYFIVQVYANNSLGYGASRTAGLLVVSALMTHPTADPTTVVLGSPVSFADNPSGGSGVDSALWRFGDGTTSVSGSPVHTYGSLGKYTVRLWVNDTNGGAVNSTLIVTVIPGPSTPAPSVWSYFESPIVLVGIVAAVALAVGVLNLVLHRKRTGGSDDEPGR